MLIFGYTGALSTLGYIVTVVTPGYCGTVFAFDCGIVLTSYVTPGGLISSSLINLYREYVTADKCQLSTETQQKRRERNSLDQREKLFKKGLEKSKQIHTSAESINYRKWHKYKKCHHRTQDR